jgi:adenylate kinase
MKMRILLLGPPGSGKGTQAEWIREKLDIPILGTGELLRSEIERETGLGKQAKGYVDSGNLVPDDLIIEMMRKRVAEPDARKGFILDGFPRSVAQAEALDGILADLGVGLESVLLIDVEEDEIVARLSSRLTCEDNGHIFSLRTNPPKNDGVCDICGGRLIRRSDDQPETIRQRLQVYKTSTEPVQGVGTVEEITQRIAEALSD